MVRLRYILTPEITQARLIDSTKWERYSAATFTDLRISPLHSELPLFSERYCCRFAIMVALCLNPTAYKLSAFKDIPDQCPCENTTLVFRICSFSFRDWLAAGVISDWLMLEGLTGVMTSLWSGNLTCKKYRNENMGKKEGQNNAL